MGKDNSNRYHYECSKCMLVGPFAKRSLAACPAADIPAADRQKVKESIQHAKQAVETIIHEERAARKKARLRELSMANARTVFY